VSEPLRTRLRAAADAIAQAVEDELAAHHSGEALLTLQNVADRLGRHESTVRRGLRLGTLDLPVVLLGGDPRVRQADLDVYIRGLAYRRRLQEAVGIVCARRTA